MFPQFNGTADETEFREKVMPAHKSIKEWFCSAHTSAALTIWFWLFKTTTKQQATRFAFFLRNSIINTWSNRWEGRSSITRFKSKKGKGQKSPSNQVDIKCQKENNHKTILDILSVLKINSHVLEKWQKCLLIYLPFHFHTTHQFYNPLCERRVSFCMLANLVAKFIQVNLVHRVGC